MAELTSESFARKRSAVRDGVDFESLREEAIRLVQALSGDIWTDFNLHDPGVTLIEAFCYALTDLVYRSDFPVADYLASKSGQIDYSQLALYRPDDIFPCAAVTLNDYRKVFLDVVPHLENVWVEPAFASEATPRGIFDVYLQLSERVKRQDTEAIAKVYVAAVEKAYSATRNLCENLRKVHILKRRRYSVCGVIELDGSTDAVDALARIYYCCDDYFNPKVPIRPYAELAREGFSFEELFTGPLTTCGYIADHDLRPRPVRFAIPELIKSLNELPGVKNVVGLYFIDADGQKKEVIDLDTEGNGEIMLAGLALPWRDAIESLQVTRAGKVCPASIHEVESEFSRIAYKDVAAREKRTHFDWVNRALPVGNARDLADYLSFQHHLPDTYGLNSYGIPHSATEERRAQAFQLKAYLIFFDQVMANFLEQLRQIHRLFSTERQLDRTYFHQVLGAEAVPDVDAIYMLPRKQIDGALSEIVHRHDHFLSRRSHLLNYLLSLYGEEFDQQALQELCSDDPDIERKLAGFKLEYLRGLVEFSARRAQGSDYLSTSHGAYKPSSLERKLALVLGLAPSSEQHEQGASRSKGYAGICVVEHILLYQGSLEAEPDLTLPASFFSNQMTVIFSPTTPLSGTPEMRVLAEEAVRENCPAHILPHVVWASKQILSDFYVVFEEWLTAKFIDRLPLNDIGARANRLARFLIELQRRSE